MARMKWKLAQYLESRWWRWYLGSKHPEEYYRWKFSYWHNFLKTIGNELSLSPDDQYLDLGCGPAGIFMVLPGHITAVDPLIEQYRNDFPFLFQHLTGKVQFYAAKAEDFRSDTLFDSVFCLNVINHVNDIGHAMHNIHRLSKPGGTLVISVDEHRWRILYHLFKWLPLDVLHPYQLKREDFEKLLISNGFEVKSDTVLKSGTIFRYRVWMAVRPE